MFKHTSLAVAALMLATAGAAQAQEVDTGAITSTITITEFCFPEGAGGFGVVTDLTESISFGSVSQGSTAANNGYGQPAAAPLRVGCGNGTTYTLSFEDGTGTNLTSRTLNGPSEPTLTATPIAYELRTGAANCATTGTALGGASVIPGTSEGATATHNVCAVITDTVGPFQKLPRSYSDEVTVTLTM